MPLILVGIISGFTGLVSGALGFFLGGGVSGLGSAIKFSVIGFAIYIGLRFLGFVK